MRIHLSTEDLALVGAIAVMGFIFSSREWLLWLNTLTPFSGLIVYYVILFISLTILAHAGLIVHKIKISNVQQVIGLLMITFAFFAVVGFSSAYVQYVTTGSWEGASVVYFQCEDGSLVYLTTLLIPATAANAETIRLIALVLAPALLTLLGVALVKGRIHLNA